MINIEKLEIKSYAQKVDGYVQQVNKLEITIDGETLRFPIDRSMTLQDIQDELFKVDLTKTNISIAAK